MREDVEWLQTAHLEWNSMTNNIHTYVKMKRRYKSTVGLGFVKVLYMICIKTNGFCSSPHLDIEEGRRVPVGL